MAGAHAPLWEDLDGDGKKELIVGRRYLAHEGRDPGEYDPLAAYRYQFDPQTRTWQRWLISYNDGICFGLDPKVADLTGSGKLDLKRIKELALEKAAKKQTAAPVPISQ